MNLYYIQKNKYFHVMWEFPFLCCTSLNNTMLHIVKQTLKLLCNPKCKNYPDFYTPDLSGRIMVFFFYLMVTDKPLM